MPPCYTDASLRDPTTPTPGECRPWLRAVGPGGLVPAGGRLGQLTVRLDSVYFDTEQHDLLAYGVTRRFRTGRTDAGWLLKIDNGCSTSRSDRGGGFTSSSESSPYVPAPSWSQERSGVRSVAVAGRGVERAGRRPGQGKRAALARRLREGAAGPARSRGGCREGDRRGLGYQVGHHRANVVRQTSVVFFQLLNGQLKS